MSKWKRWSTSQTGPVYCPLKERPAARMLTSLNLVVLNEMFELSYLTYDPWSNQARGDILSVSVIWARFPVRGKAVDFTTLSLVPYAPTLLTHGHHLAD
jgi:hypothetical protein